MARIRTIKPDFFTSLTIADLTPEQRLTFIGLWTHVDDEGRCVDDARLIKAAVWPLDDRTASDVEADLGALTEASLIARYTVAGKRFIVVTTWDEHQRINRPTPSRFPRPEDADEPPCDALTSSDVPSGGTPDVLSEAAVSPHARKGTGKGTGNRDSATRVADATALIPAPETPAEQTAQTLVAEWIEHCDDRPPGKVIGQLSREVKTMLTEGIPYEAVRAGLAEWHRKGLHPSALASVVHETRRGPRRPSPTDAVMDILAMGAEMQAEHDRQQIGA